MNRLKFKIGIFGSAVSDDDGTVQKAKELAQELSNFDVVVLTGAGSGLPYLVSYEAFKKGVEVWGFAPTVNHEKQKKLYPSLDLKIYSELYYVPEDYKFADRVEVLRKYRNVNSTATCEAGIIIAGRWGTMNEFTNLYDMGKVIGVLTGTGGVADELPNLVKKISKKSEATLIFNDSPKDLLKKVISELGRREKHKGGRNDQ